VYFNGRGPAGAFTVGSRPFGAPEPSREPSLSPAVGRGPGSGRVHDRLTILSRPADSAVALFLLQRSNRGARIPLAMRETFADAVRDMILHSNNRAPRASVRLAVTGAAVLVLLLLGLGCGADRVIELGSDGGARTDAGGVADALGADGVGADDTSADAAADEDLAPRPDAPRAADAGDDGGDEGDAVAADTPGAVDTGAGHDGGGGPDGAAADDVPARADTPEVPSFLAVTVEATTSGGFWAETERCFLDHDALVPETFIAKTRHHDADVVAAFGGDAAPPPGRFLLHAAPGWDAGGPAVLLVHGAGSHATQSFVDPDPLGRQPGLARELAAAGFAVFAVTFPARFGDNRNQGLALAAALQRVRGKTGAPAVHVVAHSKGGLPLLAYLTDLLASRGLPYQGDVGRVLLLGAPLGGMDFSFRHPLFNYSSAVWGLELPSSWDQALLYGIWRDTYDESIVGGAYDGLLQALARWDDVYPLSMLEQDWYTTYEGGQGFVSHSPGIDAAIEQGGQFLTTLRSRSLPAGLRVSLLAGTSAWVNGTLWESAGPSDALVFVDSAGDGAWIEGAGGSLAAADELALNHWSLVYDEEARAWVREQLTAE
jgi:hypothetical protein